MASGAVVNGFGQIAFLVERRDQHAVFVIKIAEHSVAGRIDRNRNRRNRGGCRKDSQRGCISGSAGKPASAVIFKCDYTAD